MDATNWREFSKHTCRFIGGDILSKGPEDFFFRGRIKNITFEGEGDEAEAVFECEWIAAMSSSGSFSHWKLTCIESLRFPLQETTSLTELGDGNISFHHADASYNVLFTKCANLLDTSMVEGLGLEERLMQALTWGELLLAAHDYIGWDIESTNKDGVIHRGPVASIMVKRNTDGTVLRFESDWMMDRKANEPGNWCTCCSSILELPVEEVSFPQVMDDGRIVFLHFGVSNLALLPPGVDPDPSMAEAATRNCA